MCNANTAYIAEIMLLNKEVENTMKTMEEIKTKVKEKN